MSQYIGIQETTTVIKMPVRVCLTFFGKRSEEIVISVFSDTSTGLIIGVSVAGLVVVVLVVVLIVVYKKFSGRSA